MCLNNSMPQLNGSEIHQKTRIALPFFALHPDSSNPCNLWGQNKYQSYRISTFLPPIAYWERHRTFNSHNFCTILIFNSLQGTSVYSNICHIPYRANKINKKLIIYACPARLRKIADIHFPARTHFIKLYKFICLSIDPATASRTGTTFRNGRTCIIIPTFRYVDALSNGLYILGI